MADTEPQVPWLAMAAWCEDATGQDHRISIVNVIGQLVFTVEGLATPSEMPEWSHRALFVLSLTPRSGQRSVQFEVLVETPSGDILHTGPDTLDFRDDVHTSTAVFPLGITFHEPGLHWLIVECQGRTLTRLPIEIVYERRGL